VARQLSLDLELVRGMVEELASNRLVYFDGQRALALALPDQARRAFATESAFDAPAVRGPVDADLPWTEGSRHVPQPATAPLQAGRRGVA
jgi:hypothetical protein